MSSPVDTAVGNFLAETNGALALLRSDLAALSPKEQRRRPLGDRVPPTMTPESQAMRCAAILIRDAERRYSQSCLTALAGAGASAERVVEARKAGDAIVRFAASALTRRCRPTALATIENMACSVRCQLAPSAFDYAFRT